MGKVALKKEKDSLSKQRLEKLEKELSELKEENSGIEIHWKAEKEIIGKIKRLNKEVGELRVEKEQAERISDLQRVAEIQYGKIPELEKNLIELQEELSKIQSKRQILKEEVGEEDIAKVVSRWTSTPVESILEE